MYKVLTDWLINLPLEKDGVSQTWCSTDFDGLTQLSRSQISTFLRRWSTNKIVNQRALAFPELRHLRVGLTLLSVYFLYFECVVCCKCAYCLCLIVFLFVLYVLLYNKTCCVLISTHTEAVHARQIRSTIFLRPAEFSKMPQNSVLPWNLLYAAEYRYYVVRIRSNYSCAWKSNSDRIASPANCCSCKHGSDSVDTCAAHTTHLWPTTPPTHWPAVNPSLCTMVLSDVSCLPACLARLRISCFSLWININVTRHSQTSDSTPVWQVRNAASLSRIATWPITAERHVIHKTEVHNASQRRQRRIEPRPRDLH